MSVLSSIWSFVTSKYFPLYLIYRLLEKLGLKYLIWFVILVVPSLLGTFAYLTSQGVHPLVSLFATIGIQFGGQIIEVWNAALQIRDAKGLVEALIIFSGASLSVLRLLWFYYVFNWISDNMEPMVSDLYKVLIGTLLLAMSTVIAIMVDVYALPSGRHLSGYSYVLANPGIVLDPLRQIVVQSPGDTAQALNRSLNNSSTGG